MKNLYKPLCVSLLAGILNTTHAQNYNTDLQQTNENTKKLVTYLLNLGAYLGYNLSQSPGSGNTIQPNPTLLDVNELQLAQTYSFYTLMGAIPVNAVTQQLSQFVPQGQKGMANLNAFANYVFSQQNYSSPASQQGNISVNSLIDQKNYQNDPVSQGVLNILGTPDDSFCMDNTGKNWQQDCDLLYQSLVSNNVIGEIPSTQKFFTFQEIQPFLPQLNSNTLVGPLLYDVSNPSQQGKSAGGSGVPESDSSQGLNAVNQAQVAANFIRYVSGGVVPLNLPSYQTYDNLYLTATNKNLSEVERKAAQRQLSNYLASLRTYSAKMSVALGNFYYIFAKRMPQNLNTENSQQKSQALTEFTMATHRLFNPDLSANKQWVNDINNASSATVQKEMAVLLAEINYQLYLNRQQQERLLLTNSVLLLQNAETLPPNISANSQ